MRLLPMESGKSNIKKPPKRSTRKALSGGYLQRLERTSRKKHSQTMGSLANMAHFPRSVEKG